MLHVLCKFRVWLLSYFRRCHTAWSIVLYWGMLYQNLTAYMTYHPVRSFCITQSLHHSPVPIELNAAGCLVANRNFFYISRSCMYNASCQLYDSFHYTPCTTKLLGGYIGFTLSVHLSFCPSRILLCSAYSSGWIHVIFIHLINQLQKVCLV